MLTGGRSGLIVSRLNNVQIVGNVVNSRKFAGPLNELLSDDLSSREEHKRA